ARLGSGCAGRSDLLVRRLRRGVQDGRRTRRDPTITSIVVAFDLRRRGYLMSARKNDFSATAVGLALASLLGAAPAADANAWSCLGLDGARGRASDEKSGAAFSPAWNASPTGGAFVASPAVVDGFVVLASARGDVSALRVVDGSEAWTVNAAGG